MTASPTETDRQTPHVTRQVPVLKQVFPLPDGFSLLAGSELPTWIIDRDVAIGREVDLTAGIRLEHDGKVSKLHALLRPHGEGIELLDQGSKNHTFVNGKQFANGGVRDGAVIRIGNTLFVLRFERPDVVDAPRSLRTLHERLLGKSQEVRTLRHALSLAAHSVDPVLLTGPTGTGKEMGAAAIHALSSRSSRPLVAVNCAAIPQGAAESALFGHRRGSFTGAERDHDGYFKQADGSTLLLDEVAELPLEVQAKLLRTLQPAVASVQIPPGHNVLRVQSYGGQSEFQVDVRIIAATHDLRAAATAGRFREDLLQRLAVLPVRFPSLAARREDILPLIQHYLNIASRGRGIRQVSARLAELLLLYHWPGNVRELENLCKRLRAIYPTAEIVEITDLPDDMLEQLAEPPAGDEVMPNDAEQDRPPITRELLVRLLGENDGKISVVAKILRRSAKQIRRLMDQFGIFRPHARGSCSATGMQESHASDDLGVEQEDE